MTQHFLLASSCFLEHDYKHIAVQYNEIQHSTHSDNIAVHSDISANILKQIN